MWLSIGAKLESFRLLWLIRRDFVKRCLTLDCLPCQVLPKIYFGSSSLYLHLQMNNNQRGRSVVFLHSQARECLHIELSLQVHLCPASSPSLIQMIRIMVFSGATNFLLASIFVLQCVAQSNRQFQWSFRDKVSVNGLTD